MRPTNEVLRNIENIDLKTLSNQIEILKLCIDTRIDQQNDPDSYSIDEIGIQKGRQAILLERIQTELNILQYQFSAIVQYLEA